MCGVTALVGSVPGDVVLAAVKGAARRGPHTNGWAYLDGDGWRVERSAGRLGLPKHAGRVRVGHSRLATSGRRPGDAPPVEESQPYESGRYLIAHNGTVRAAQTPVDSLEVLRRLETGSDPLSAFDGSPQALIWAADGWLRAVRVPGDRLAAHPLYAAEGVAWWAVASGPLPGGRLLGEGETWEVPCS